MSTEGERQQDVRPPQPETGPSEPGPMKANALFGEVPNRHEPGESAMEGAKSDLIEDLDSISRLKGKRLGIVVVVAAACLTALLLLVIGFTKGASSDLSSGTAVKVGEYTFNAPKGWSVKSAEAEAGPQQQMVALVNPSGDDAVRVMVMDKESAGASSETVRALCKQMESSMKSGLKDGNVNVKGSPVDGLEGCSLRGVGISEGSIKDLNGGMAPGKVSMIVSVVKAKDDSVVTAFGAHSGKTQLADGQVELSIMDQLKPALTK